MLTAHDGTSFPSIGLGTGHPKGFAAAQAVTSGIEVGYRLVDSAFNYENEGAVGQGIRAASISRSEVMLQSKLPGRHHEFAVASEIIEESVIRAGVEHIDVYLIHWPNPKVGKYVEAWRALVEARERGLVRHIGVSNFLPEHLERLEGETGVRPVVNQLELHPAFPQAEALEYHQERGIVVQAWSPTGRGGAFLSAPEITEVAAAHGVSPVEAVVAWHAARGVLPIVRSGNAERQAANLAAVDIRLSNEEVAKISSLGRPDGRIRDQDPNIYEEF